ncbi:hypothetical protein B5M47_02530 [candidate division CPR3 bacterium 4484_211]|uniref:Tetratricopeptide repeat-like domain-containing protein n=1 Tax=candidate division CPR3 bacterium 4484_211 TaxID=1968527 RepID=A0A1W9NXS8_UNCC3|nr:MAG: hypothetical protein B5M47_02530 [candidate division CPR3 bacterium 4484_211]
MSRQKIFSWLQQNGGRLLASLGGIALLIIILVSIRQGLLHLTRRRTSELLNQAQSALNAKEYSKAVSLYKLTLDYNPNLLPAYQKMAEIYLLKNKYSEAENILLKGLCYLKDPAEKAHLNLNLGKVAMAAHNYSAAAIYFSQADLNLAENKLFLAKAYLKEGEISKAKEILEEFPQTDDKPACIYYYKALASILTNLNSSLSFIFLSHEKSIEQSDSACSTTSTRLKNNIEEALSRNNELDKKTFAAYALLQEDYPNLATKILKEVTLENPEYRDAQALLGAAFLSLQDYENAKTPLKKSVEIDPNYAYGHYLLGQLYSQTNNNESAQQEFQAALNLAPDKLSYYDAYLEFLEKQKAYPDMENTLKQLTAREELSAAQRKSYEIKLIYLYLDHLSNAQKGLDLAQKYQDSEVYAWALYKNKQSNNALEIIQTLLEKSPTAWLYYHQGVILKSLGRTTAAQESFQRAVDLDLDGQITKLCDNELR